MALSETVNAVNDAPVASGSATLAAIDEDTALPSGATVTSLFGGNFSDAADQVTGGSSANTFAGIAISSYTADATKGAWQYSSNGGTSWTALGSATAAAAITLNAADLLRFVPAANYNGSATALSANLIESGQTITDGATLDLTGATGGTTHISSGTAALSETINAVNDPPVLGDVAGTESYTAQAAAVTLSSGLTVSDPDNANLASAAVTISSGFQTGDVLAATTTGSITAAYDAGTHVLTLSGSDTLAHYQQVLDSITFASTSGNTSSRTISWSASDGSLASNTPTTTVNVTAPPVTGYIFTPDAATLGNLEGSNHLDDSTQIGTFTQAGGNPGDTYTFTIGGTDASNFSATAGANLENLSTPHSSDVQRQFRRKTLCADRDG